MWFYRSVIAFKAKTEIIAQGNPTVLSRTEERFCFEFLYRKLKATVNRQ